MSYEINSHSTGIEAEFDLICPCGGRKNTSELIESTNFSQYEISPHTIEIGTNGGNSITESLKTIFDQIKQLSKELKQNTNLFPFGSLPNKRSRQEHKDAIDHLQNHPNEYYKYLLRERDGSIVSSNLDVNGLQFHVGIADSDNFEILLKRYNALRFLTPLFQGLAASSPIRDSIYRGYSSERALSKKGLPKSGVPDFLDSLEQLDFILGTNPSHVKSSLSPGYYPIRLPRQDINTTELCSMDMIPDKDLIVSLLDLYLRICKKIDVSSYHQLPENIFGNHNQLRMSHIINTNFQSVENMQQCLRDTQVVLSNNSMIPFNQWLKNIFEWIEEIPSQILSQNTTNSLMTILEKGTHSEQLIQSLQQLEIIQPYSFGDVQSYNTSQMHDIVNLYRQHAQTNLFSKL